MNLNGRKAARSLGSARLATFGAAVILASLAASLGCGTGTTTIGGGGPCDGLADARLCVDDALVICEDGEETHREVCQLGCQAGQCLSDDPCEPAPGDGWYCASDLESGQAGARYHCVDGETTAFESCELGCADGECISADPCVGAPSDGWHCAESLGAGQPGARYECVDGATAGSEYCEHGCEDGECVPPDVCAGAGADGWYCSDTLGAGSPDTRYHCVDGTAASSEYCEHGCEDGECVLPEPLELLPDGVYFFYVKASGKALNLYASTDQQADQDGTNVTVWRPTAHNTQRFRVENVGGDRSRIYAMSSSLGTNRVIDVSREGTGDLQIGNNIHLWRPVTATDHEWIISKVEGNYYKVELASLPGAAMGSEAPGTDGGNVALQQYTGSDAQLWQADFLSDGDCITPVEYYESLGWGVTQEFWDNSTFNPQHRGMDFGGKPCDYPVKSIYPGTVVAARTSGMGTWGHTVVVEIAPGWYQHNSHLNAIHVSEGQAVDRGTQIGLNGGTNHSGDPFPCHIHLEIYQNDPVDPSRPWRHPDGGLVSYGTGLVNPRDFCM